MVEGQHVVVDAGERATALDPDALMLADEHGRRISWSEFTQLDRAGRGRASTPGASESAPSSRGSCRRAIETIVLSMALSRLGADAEPDHPPLPRTRGRLAAAHHGRDVVRAPRRLESLRLRARWPAAIQATLDRPCTLLDGYADLPKATRPRCRRRRPTATPCGGCTRRRARPRSPRPSATPTAR